MTSMLNPIKRRDERCRHTRDHMSEYLDGELDAQTAVRVERHARWCPNCHRMLANLARTIAGLRRLRDEPTPPED
jgi:anti-sigma factor RsiW